MTSLSQARSAPRSVIVTAITGVWWAIAAAPVSAQESPTELAEVVVTAQKRAQNIEDVGMSVDAFSADQIASVGITNAEGLAKVVTGLNVIYGSTGVPIYTLRGIGFYDAAIAAPPTVSLYLDEMPVPFASMARGIARDVRQVEVLKGPQGTLYGQNATGGSINFSANRPTSAFEAGADVDYSNFGKFDGSGFVSGPITDKIRARLSLSGTYGGAWQKSYTVGDELGNARTITGRLLVDWDAAENLTLQLNVNGWKDNSDELAGQVVALVSSPSRQSAALQALYALYPSSPPDARFADWDHGFINGEVDPHLGRSFDGFERRANFTQTGLRANYSLGNITITSITAWDKLNQLDFYDGDGMNGNDYSATNGCCFETFSQELRAAGTVGRLQWIAGGNYQHDDVSGEGAIFNTIGTFPFHGAATIGKEKFRTSAAFANATYSITDTLDVLAGIRYTDVHISNRGCTTDGGDGAFSALLMATAARHGVNIYLPPGDCITLDPKTYLPAGLYPNHLNQTNVPFKVGLDWKASPDTLTYLNMSRGYKAGTFSMVGAQYTPQLDPAVQEEVTAYELGVKKSLWDRRLQINGAAFRMDYDDKQVRGKALDSLLGLVNKTINVPKSRVQGAELEATWVPNEHWYVMGSAGYLHSQILENFTNYSFGGVLMNMNGQPLPLTPRWQAGADVQYEMPVTTTLRAFVGSHLRYLDSTFSGLGAEHLFETPAYATLDFRGGVMSSDGRWKVTAYVNNATDRYSWNFVTLTGPDTVIRYANMPRVFGIRVSVRNQ